MNDGNWIENRIRQLEIDSLQKIFECRTPEAVEATVTYARFLANLGVTPENCSAFLRLLEIENRWVSAALVGDQDPFRMLSVVQPSRALIEHIFRTLARWPRGSVHTRNLAAMLGVLKDVYSSPREGYGLFPLTVVDLNTLGKHLVKEKGQDDPVNRAILACLDKLSLLENADDAAADQIAVQATTIRNAFFDDRRKMIEVIPKVMLEAGEAAEEVAPRKPKPLAEEAGSPSRSKQPSRSQPRSGKK